jgi:hypothetical protein
MIFTSKFCNYPFAQLHYVAAQINHMMCENCSNSLKANFSGLHFKESLATSLSLAKSGEEPLSVLKNLQGFFININRNALKCCFRGNEWKLSRFC